MVILKLSRLLNSGCFCNYFKIISKKCLFHCQWKAFVREEEEVKVGEMGEGARRKEGMEVLQRK